MREASRWCVAAVAAVLALPGCTADEAGADPLGYLARQDEAGDIAGARIEARGTIVQLDNGCLMLDRDGSGVPWIVWPPGTMPGDGATVDVAGRAYAPGDRVRVTGTIAVLADLPGGNDADTYFGAQGQYCGADSAGVVVLDSIAPAD